VLAGTFFAVFSIPGVFAASFAAASSGSAFSSKLVTSCVADFAALSRPDPATGPRNSQLAIWTLEARGKTAAAAELKKQTTEALQKAKIYGSPVEVPGVEAKSLVFLELEGGLRGVWKTGDDDEFTPLREIRKEVTAYNFDQMIGAGIVPITVRRSFRGRPGVVQLFVRDVDAADLTYNPHSLKLFDFLIAHADRTQLNHLTHRGRTIAIDNEGTFAEGPLNPVVPEFDKFVLEILQKVDAAEDSVDAKTAAKNLAISEISPTLLSKDAVEKLRTTTDAEWKKGLTGLNSNELKAFLDRKNRAVKAIDLAVEKLGPDVFAAGRFSGLSRNQWTRETKFLRTMAGQLPSGQMRKDAARALSILEGQVVSGRPVTNEQIDFIDRVLTELEKFEAGSQTEK